MHLRLVFLLLAAAVLSAQARGAARRQNLYMADVVRYRYLRALPSAGVYAQGGVYSEYLRAMRLKSKLDIEDGFVKGERSVLPSFYLAPTKLVAETITSEGGGGGGEEKEEGEEGGGKQLNPYPESRTILRSIVPVPIRTSRDDIEASLMAALVASQLQQQQAQAAQSAQSPSPTASSAAAAAATTPASAYSWKGAAITDRDRGVYDALSPLYGKWLLRPTGGKDLYNVLKNTGAGGLAAAASASTNSANANASPYHCFVAALELVLGLRVTGIILEVADSPNAASLSLGAAILVAKTGPGQDHKPWVLTKSNYKELTKAAARLSASAKLLDCHIDEALGIHLATQIPIIASDSLYKRICVDGLLERRPETGAMVISSPYFSSRGQAQSYAKLLDESRARPAKPVRKVTEITDATTFLKMRLSEKRACLRASGLTALPKPREGPRKVDAIMIPLLDEEVAYEVLRRLGECRGDFALAANMADFETRKPALARAYNVAVKAGRLEEARSLIEEFNSLATLRYDPSNPEEEVYASSPGAGSGGKGGAAGGGFDIEEWYWEARKRVYGIIAA